MASAARPGRCEAGELVGCRALLERRLLLHRDSLPVLDAIEQLTDVDADLLRAVGPNQKLDSGDDRALLQQAGWQRSALPPAEERGCADRHQVGHGGTQELPGRILIEINKKVGHRLVTKFGQRGVIDLAKLVPAVGGLIDATADGVGCHVIAVYAKSAFPALIAVDPSRCSLSRSESSPITSDARRASGVPVGCTGG